MAGFTDLIHPILGHIAALALQGLTDADQGLGFARDFNVVAWVALQDALDCQLECCFCFAQGFNYVGLCAHISLQIKQNPRSGGLQVWWVQAVPGVTP